MTSIEHLQELIDYLNKYIVLCADEPSDHPVQKYLGIKKITVVLSELLLAVHPELREILKSQQPIFTAAQENFFARLQIICNEQRISYGYNRLSLLHLSPRLFLRESISIATESCTAQSTLHRCDAADIAAYEVKGCSTSISTYKEEEKKKNKKKKNKKKKNKKDLKASHDIMDNITVAHNEGNVDLIDDSGSELLSDAPIFESNKYQQDNMSQISPLDARVDVTRNIEKYELLLMEMRERHEEAVRLLNLRLYIANMALENEREIRDQIIEKRIKGIMEARQIEL